MNILARKGMPCVEQVFKPAKSVLLAILSQIELRRVWWVIAFVPCLMVVVFIHACGSRNRVFPRLQSITDITSVI